MTAYMPAAFNGGDYAHNFQAESEAFDEGHHDFTTGAPRRSFGLRGPVRIRNPAYRYPAYPGAYNPGAHHQVAHHHPGAHHPGGRRPPQGGANAEFLRGVGYEAYMNSIRKPVQIAGMSKRKKKQKKRSVPLNETEKKAMTRAKTVYFHSMENLLQEVQNRKETRESYLKRKKKITLALLNAQNDIVKGHVASVTVATLKAKYETEIAKKDAYCMKMKGQNVAELLLLEPEKWQKQGAFTEFVAIMLAFYRDKAAFAESANDKSQTGHSTLVARQTRNRGEKETIKVKSLALQAWRKEYGFEPPVKRGKGHQAQLLLKDVHRPVPDTDFTEPPMPKDPEVDDSDEEQPYALRAMPHGLKRAHTMSTPGQERV